MINKTTQSGIRYGEGDFYPIRENAPLLINLCSTADDGLDDSYFGRIARLCGSIGFRTISLDLPCHGSKITAGESEGLQGWSDRFQKGDDPVNEILQELKLVVDELQNTGLLNNKLTVISGTSRGGFLALCALANDHRLNYGIAFAPVTNLLYLKEFISVSRSALCDLYDLHQKSAILALRKIYLTIGNCDDRVSTSSVIELTSKIINSARNQNIQPQVELHLNSIAGHTTQVDGHDRAFEWLKNEMLKI